MPAASNETSLDRKFHALADPIRRHVYETLSRGSRTASELAAPFGMSLPALSHHLRLLESSGLVGSQKAGRSRSFHVEQDAIAEIERWAQARRKDWERRLGRLDAFLAATDEPPPSPAPKPQRRSR